MKTDLIFCPIIGLIVFAIHSSNIFTALEPELNIVSKYICFLIVLIKLTFCMYYIFVLCVIYR